MTAQKITQITKDTGVYINAGLLIALVAGVWTLAVRVIKWENQLQEFDRRLKSSWTYEMEREATIEWVQKNPTLIGPNIPQIRRENLIE